MVSLSSLKDLNFLYENDIYDLARIITKIYRAKNVNTNYTSFITIHGLSSIYSRIANVALEKVESFLNEAGLASKLNVDNDEDSAD